MDNTSGADDGSAATDFYAVCLICVTLLVAGCGPSRPEPRQPNERDLFQVPGKWVQAEYARVLIDTLDESATKTLGGAAADAAHSGGASLLKAVVGLSSDVFPDGDYVWHDKYIPAQYQRFDQHVEGYEFRGEFCGRCYYRRSSGTR